MSLGCVHIVGAGLAGLSAAVRASEAGWSVRLYEAAPFAGGRCRTFHDPRLGLDVDNGNHLLLSGNRAAMSYIRVTGGRSAIQMAPSAAFPFADLATGEHWTVTMNDGRLPIWMFHRNRRVPGTALSDYLAGIRLALASTRQTVAGAITGRGALWRRFWEPMALAVLNTTPERGSAALLWRAMSETFARGGACCRPIFAPRGLGRALVDPALKYLTEREAQIRFESALLAIESTGSKASVLQFQGGESINVAESDRVVIALPPTRLKAVLPMIDAPDDSAGILNAHYLIDDASQLYGLPPVIGLSGAKTHWIFIRGNVVSLTISAADALGFMTADPDELARDLWAEVRQGLRRPDLTFATCRINKERRATFDQSPSGVARRPTARTPFSNVFLAGDATQTGLPATIEGAIRSGETAAGLLQRTAA